MKKVVVLLAFAGLVLGGCTLSKPIARQHLDFNLALEKSKNQQMLLNVVRRSMHLPTHYTALSQYLGTANSTFAPTLLSPFGGDAPNSYSLSLANSTTSGISTVSMAALDSQTFVQGIMGSLTVDNFDYYQKQGWPQELITLLFVRKLIYEGEEYLNQPTSDFKEIERFLAKIRELKIAVKSEAGQAVGPAFTLGPNETLASLILQGKAAGLELAEVQDETNTDSTTTKASPTQTESAQTQTVSNAEGAGGNIETAEATKFEFRGSTPSKVLYINDAKSRSAGSTDHDHTDGDSVVYFRSTDDIFAYLGGILRYQDVNNPKPKIRVMNSLGTATEEVALFLAEQAHKGNKHDAQVKVLHRGVHYVIPGIGDVRHRSMDVLTILAQLISLHKSSTEIPSTGVVTVTGG